MARRDRYPEIHSEDKVDKGKHPICKPCRKLGSDAEAIRYVRVSFTYMRGEDGCTQVCEKHLQEIRKLCRHDSRGGMFPKYFQGDEVWT